MINTKEFYDYLITNELELFTGVPDSLLSNLCACIKENSPLEKNIITANEGSAVAIASGYHLATNKFGVVYMQNSGIGNAVNPLLSLADEKVYKIPMLLMIGWRGEPGKKDEPQHVKQGLVTTELLKTMGINYIVLAKNYVEQIDYCIKYMKEESKPVAIVIRKDSFSDYKFEKEKNSYELTREESLKTIIENFDEDDFIVSTTGKTSREIFEIRENNNQSHSNDFLTVGSMGHTASIAYGMSIGTSKNIYCIDGDGSFIMHMGSLGIIGKSSKENMKYILINNGAHESVGGQPTIGFDIDIKKILESFGFANIYIANDLKELKENIQKLQKNSSSALIINTKQGSRKDLGRPTKTPIENKKELMKKLV